MLTWLEAKSTKTMMCWKPLSMGKSGAMSMPTIDLGLVVCVVMCNLCDFCVVYMLSWHGRHCFTLAVTLASMCGKWYFSLSVRYTLFALRCAERGPRCSESIIMSTKDAGRTIVGGLIFLLLGSTCPGLYILRRIPCLTWNCLEMESSVAMALTFLQYSSSSCSLRKSGRDMLPAWNDVAASSISQLV